ncbi:MAG: polysaccharide lyase 6 family protein [Fidelibacterota bacterium]|nr:MAG: polysaccharide lyase 6 family protein [Candidatus Neomarinimicrobiota bacterium]
MLSLIRGADYRVSNATEVRSAGALAQPGDTLTMTNGTWKDARLLFKGEGTAERPILLRAETPGLVILTGTSTLRVAGSHLIIDGLYFRDGYSRSGAVIEFRNGNGNVSRNCRLTNTAIVNYNPPEREKDYKWVSLFGSHNRVDHCYFRGKNHTGTTLVVRLSSKPNYHLIDYNYFAHRPPLGKNGGETIRVGTSQWSMYDSYTAVEHNYFERCNGEHEIISSKSCGNIYRYNTFYECAGALTLRHGNNCKVVGNYFIGNRADSTGGVRVIGENHKVYNNYFQDLAGTRSCSALSIMNGVPDSPLNRFFQVINAQIVFNTFVNCRKSIVLGYGADEEKTLPPVNVWLANNLVLGGNDEALITVVDEPLELIWQGNIMYGAPSGISMTMGITITDPLLIPSENGLWRPGRNSPVINQAMGDCPFVSEDMDGQPRDSAKDVGADEVSDEPKIRGPLTADDVGPTWWPLPSETSR